MSENIQTVEMAKNNRTWLFNTFIIFGGIVLPLVTLIVELTTQLCASVFFNPIPTVWHIISVGLVPFINLLIWLVYQGKITINGRALIWLTGLAIGLSLLYSARFLPLVVISFYLIIFFGMGFLALAPYFALSASLWLYFSVKKLSQVSNLKKPFLQLSGGILLGVLLLVFIDMPVTLTRFGLQMATAPSPKTQLNGIQFLRSFGDRDFLLRSCYVRSGYSDLLALFFKQVDPDKARSIFYRVTGVPFNSLPRPNFTRPGFFRGGSEFDEDQGETNVAGKLNNLLLSSSRLDGSIDSEGDLAYLEWTMTFKNNDSLYDKEARSQIALPPGAVVSRLTLWINGEEREAAFATKGKVTEAYQKVVRQQRDPVLVTSSGQDRIMVQCFPVPRNGGEMKIRLGITIPLKIADLNTSKLYLPYIIERNFDITDDLTHSVWIDANNSLQSTIPKLNLSSKKEHSYTARGLINGSELISRTSVIQVKRNHQTNRAWSVDPYDKQNVIIQEISKEEFIPKHIVMVIDGSQSLSKVKPVILNSLALLPADVPVSMLIASDEVIEFSKTSFSGTPKTLTATEYTRFKKIRFIGGQDNLPALVRAWDLAENSDSMIIWIHGPQPALLSSIEYFNQRLERQSETPRFYSIPMVNGPNIILEKINPVLNIRVIPVHHPGKDLEMFFSSIGSSQFELIRKKVSPDAVASASNHQTSTHLTRLWANDQVHQLLQQTDSKTNQKDAAKLAISYQLVTPLTGAVVLENENQYKTAELHPVDPGTVPTIPEPETWMMIIIALVLLILLVWYSRRRIICKPAI